MISIKKSIKKIQKSKDGKTLLTNFGYLSLLQVAGYIFPLFTVPYLARVIGVDGYGKLAFASAIMVWFQTIADWGFNYSATRDVAKHREDKEKVIRIFSTVLWGRCVLTVLSFIVLIVMILAIPKFNENSLIILITFMTIPGHIFFPEWFFQALERMKYITIFGFIIKLIFLIAIFVFVKEKDDYILQPIISTSGSLICGIISMYIIVRKWGYKVIIVPFGQIINTIKIILISS
jgi:Membrane protein involved in the export of O-antigen and teichoic acid